MKVIFLTILLIIGVYLIIAYQPHKGTYIKLLNKEQERKERMYRHLGLIFIVVSIGLGLYFYYTGRVTIKTQMPNSNGCRSCQHYITRHRNLNPYKESEYSLLVDHAKGCDDCSRQCLDNIQIESQYLPRAKINQMKNECINTTKNAMYANSELNRLTEKLRQKQSRLWQATKQPEYNPLFFPQVPKHKPQ